jgi:type IV secretion system protein VirD4
MNLIDVLIDKIIRTTTTDGRAEIANKYTDNESIKSLFIVGFIIMTLIINLLVESLDSVGGLFTGRSFNPFMILIPRVFSYFPIYLLFYSLYFILYYKVMAKLRLSYGKLHDGEKGTARFTTREELDQQYKSVPKKDLRYPGKGGVPIARNVENEEIYIDDSPVNNLIIGTTRSGKGEMFVFPTIDIYSRAEEQPSMIINDPKGELVSASKEILEERGYEVLLLNLIDLMNSMSYNPLQLILEAYKAERFSEAQLLCKNLTHNLYSNPESKDPFFENSAMSLVNALILAVCDECISKNEEHKVTLYTVACMLESMGSNNYIDKNDMYVNELDEYFKSLPEESVARKQYATSAFASGKTRASIFSSAMIELQLYTFDEIAKLTSKNSIDLKSIGFNTEDNYKPKAIFMATPDYDKSNHRLASIFIGQSYYQLAKHATLGNGKCDREVVYLLDEAGNLPCISELPNMITVCLGRNIRVNLVIQAYSQLEKIYGKDSKTIEANCGNQIYILTNENETAEKFSRLIGEKTQSVFNRTGDIAESAKTHTESMDARRLLKADELMTLKEGETVVSRVIKRQDKERNKIVPYPICNFDEYSMQYRYEYLNEFDNTKGLYTIKINTIHKDVNLTELHFKTKNASNNTTVKSENLIKETFETVKVKVTELQMVNILKIAKNYLDNSDLLILKNKATFEEIQEFLYGLDKATLFDHIVYNEFPELKEKIDIF